MFSRVVRQQNLPDEPRGHVHSRPTGYGPAVREPLDKIQKIIKEINP